MVFNTLLLLFGILTLVLHADMMAVTAEPNSKIRFFCIHSFNTTYTEIGINDPEMMNKLDFQIDLTFFIHGWKSEFNIERKDDITYKIGLAWVNAQPTNFCGVDWKGLASDGYYDAAIKHVKTVGKQVAAFISAVKALHGKVDSISIAGHSLGAQAAGYAAKTIYESKKTKIATIFALDPAAPLFTVKVPLIASDYCLSKNDSNFVQVLHTTSTLGTSKNIGHADFFANGGNKQSACWDVVLKFEDLCKLF